MTSKTTHQSEADLRAVLTTLAERWEQMAKSLTKGHPTTLFAEITEFQRAEAAEAVAYRKAAADVREALTSGRLPHDLMTDAELEQHGTESEAAR